MDAIKTELARDMKLREGVEQYDEHCKRLLGYKVILAWILKSVLTEYEGMSTEEVIRCIEDEPAVSSVRVNPGETNRIDGRATEDRVSGEGAVCYDIRFEVRFPGTGERKRGIINLEGQKKFRPGYSLVTRGIFYGSRMVSAQMGVEFTAPDYDGIKHVFSIWICTNSPDYIGNAVTRFRMRKEGLLPGYPDQEEEYDKLTVILICLNPKCKNGNQLTDLLNTIFSNSLTAEEKCRRLEEEFQIRMEEKFGEEMKLMCNIGEGIMESAIEKGLQKGMQQGMERGIQQGIQKEKESTVLRMLERGEFSDEQITELAGVTQEFLDEVRAARV